ncbi:hypothetical protein H4582DRAFT_1439180 [Lactarius indigo]|nr:hypothetical protein H4582DRAFT_1439180 [Lactarius indigo]
MSQSPLPTTSSSNFDSIFQTAVKAYKKRTGQDITSHPLATQLKTCNSPDAILIVLRAQVEEFDQSRRDDERLTKWLNPTVNVLYAFSATLGEGVGLVTIWRLPCPKSARSLSCSRFSLRQGDLCRNWSFALGVQGCCCQPRCSHRHLRAHRELLQTARAYTEVPQTTAMTDIVVMIMVEVLSIFAIATKEIRQGRAKKFFKKLVGRRDIEDALERLDKLTQEEARMATAELLRLTHSVDYEVKASARGCKTSTGRWRVSTKGSGVLTKECRASTRWSMGRREGPRCLREGPSVDERVQGIDERVQVSTEGSKVS